jgi:hypothetical protein
MCGKGGLGGGTNLEQRSKMSELSPENKSSDVYHESERFSIAPTLRRSSSARLSSVDSLPLS